MAGYSRQFPNNISPKGTTVQQGFENDDKEFKYLYELLAKSGALQLFDSKRQSILCGPVDSNGDLNFISNNNLNVNIDGSKIPIILSFANGFSITQGTVDLIDNISSLINTAWVLPANTTCYLYVDKDASTGLLSFGYTTSPCPSDKFAPASPVLDQHYFNVNEMKMYRYNGSSWEQKLRIFIAIAITTTSAVTAKIKTSAQNTGFISLYSGSVASIPNGWHLCDGSYGTPDLRDRMIVGAGSTYTVGQVGGEASHILSQAEMPSHNHTAWTDGQGNHDHTNTHPSGNGAGGAYGWYMSSYGGGDASLGVGAGGLHAHNVGIGLTGSGGAHNNMPPYYALCYIMQL